MRVLLGLLAVATAAACAGLASARTGGAGSVQQFEPRSATTWWAIVDDTTLVRTTDGGKHWRRVKTPVGYIGSSAFVGLNAAWIAGTALHPPRSDPVYRTLDGGRTWQRLAKVPDGCALEFVDLRHGWCAGIGAAMGQSSVRLYGTSDGGSTWKLVSLTDLVHGPQTPGALPSACDKQITFTSRTVGWSTSYCSGWPPQVYRSTDGGWHWHALATIPAPPNLRKPNDGGIEPPIVDGTDVTAVVDACCHPDGTTAVATSRNSGSSWRTVAIPGPFHNIGVAVVDAHHWRVNDGTYFRVTDNGGRTWRAWPLGTRLFDRVGYPLGLTFLTPRLGFAVPTTDGGVLRETRDGGRTWTRISLHF